ncbi:MAG: hypothetical protein KAT05_08605 [Spirochaetes bacterium]|nr:hypothetical protein [Spirochaetota bacterium]
MNSENEDILNKLRFIPKEELANLVIKVYSSDDEKLKNAIKRVTGRKIRKTANFILKSDSDTCISILAEFGDLSSKYIKKIEGLFKEYQYGSNPNLYFSQLISPDWKEFVDIKESLPNNIEEKSVEFSSESENKFVEFKVLDISKSDDVVEIILEYHKRIDYIDTETAEPAFVYTLEEGIVWLVKTLDALIVKSSDYKVNYFIRDIMQKYFNCKIRIFSLHKNIINTVMGTESLKSGSYYKLHAGPDEIEGKSIRDKHLMAKSEGRETDENYDRKSSFHKIKEITDSETGININSQQGKISIRKHLRKTDVKEWALKIISRTIEEMIALKDSDINTYLKGYQLDSVDSLKEVKKGGKEIIRDIVIGINKVKSKNKVNFSTVYSVNDLYTKARDYFDFDFIPVCNSCGSNFYICNVTGEDNGLALGGVGFTATCNSCNEKIVDVNNHFTCNCGKQLEGGLDENVVALPTGECVNLINSMVEEMELKFKLDSNELLKFLNGGFEIIKTNYKYLYLFDELPAFNNIPKLEEIEPIYVKAQLHNIKTELSEKCNNYKDSNCRNCLIDKKGNCLQRVIASFTMGDLHAHSPVEFGDVSFRQNLNGSSKNIVCLAKSYKEAPKVSGDHKFTMKNNSGLLNQVVDTVLDSRVDFLGIISGADLDPRLRESIINLVRMRHKKVVFFEKNELIRILSKYEW